MVEVEEMASARSRARINPARRRRPSRFGAADHATAAARAGSGAPLHAVEAGVLAGAGC